MPSRTPPRWWRGFLLASNAILPIPTLSLLFAGVPGALWMLAATLSAHGLLLWAIMAPRATWLGPIVSQFTNDNKEIWLTIDDGPVGDETRALSADLRERGVAATFFFIGSRLRGDLGAAADLQRDGHAIANHSGTHPRKGFWCSSGRRAQREVDEGIEALREAGCESPYFRPPVGHKPPGLHRALQRRGLKLISWETGGRDGWVPDATATVARILEKVTPGAIIVLHEGRAHSRSTILAVVDALLAEGYQFVIPAADRLLDEVSALSGVESRAARANR